MQYIAVAAYDDQMIIMVQSHLHTDSDIINNHDFESGIIKIQCGRGHMLSPQETDAVRIFKKPVAPRNAPPPEQTLEPATYASSIRNAVRAEKRLSQNSLLYFRNSRSWRVFGSICLRR